MPVILEQIGNHVLKCSIRRLNAATLIYNATREPMQDHRDSFMEFLSQETGQQYKAHTNRHYEPRFSCEWFSDRLYQSGCNVEDYIIFRGEVPVFGGYYVTIMKTNGDYDILNRYEELLRRVVDVGEI